MYRSRYEVLLLDLDGTLVDYDRTERAALQEIHLSTYAGRVGFLEFRRLFADCNTALWDAYRSGEVDLDRLRLERFAVLGRAIGADVAPGVAAARYEESLGRNAALFGDVRAALRLLARRFRLVLVTDGIARVQHHKLSRTRLAGMFDQVVISAECGLRKPQPELLWRALDLTGGTVTAALVVGDSLDSDGVGAWRAGVDFCWLHRGARTRPGPDGTGTGTRSGHDTVHVRARLAVRNLRVLARVLSDGCGKGRGLLAGRPVPPVGIPSLRRSRRAPAPAPAPAPAAR